MIFNQDFTDFINLLEKNQVRYVLVGGLAVVMNGHFRTTKDMDIFYEGSSENCQRLLQVIKDFGFGYLKLTEEDLADKKGFIKLGTEPNRIDLFCDLPGVLFEEVFANAFEYKEEESLFSVRVIHINQLIQNKKAVGRLQDKLDVEKLEKIRKRKTKR